jgi:hypothetical protein
MYYYYIKLYHYLIFKKVPNLYFFISIFLLRLPRCLIKYVLHYCFFLLFPVVLMFPSFNLSLFRMLAGFHTLCIVLAGMFQSSALRLSGVPKPVFGRYPKRVQLKSHY